MTKSIMTAMGIFYLRILLVPAAAEISAGKLPDILAEYFLFFRFLRGQALRL
jgi:hypothetical protein